MEKNREVHGFTLIELLVVIAIIALLLGVLIPSLNKAKMVAQTVICGTNLRSYGTALQTYAEENKGLAPFMVSWLYKQKTVADLQTNLGLSKGCVWHYDKPDGSLWPYLSANDVHMCPVFGKYAKKMGKDECPNASTHSARTPYIPTYSYSMNWHLGFDWDMLPVVGNTVMFEKEYSMKIARVRNPAGCFAFSEENLWHIEHREMDRDNGKIYSWNVLNDNALWMNANKTKPDEATDNMATYHNVNVSRQNEGKANVVFVDGHVALKLGYAGREAYMNYAKPYPGHDNGNIW
jgi:prepilin-type N-terminal cleavage/methylation domain-containing protein/prepilin-type processing-associated H-X9-DG protein